MWKFLKTFALMNQVWKGSQDSTDSHRIPWLEMLSGRGDSRAGLAGHSESKISCFVKEFCLQMISFALAGTQGPWGHWHQCPAQHHHTGPPGNLRETGFGGAKMKLSKSSHLTNLNITLLLLNILNSNHNWAFICTFSMPPPTKFEFNSTCAMPQGNQGLGGRNSTQKLYNRLIQTFLCENHQRKSNLPFAAPGTACPKF